MTHALNCTAGFRNEQVCRVLIVNGVQDTNC
uniref:Uncharacterized protein n=1 Tax=Anguilla anguilla TaxID=7936 RepID=A0A0E9UF93_ANGAN